MTQNILIRRILTFSLIIVIQIILIIYGIDLFKRSFCYIYVSVLLMIPIQFNRIWLMVVGFGLGFTIDLFYSTPGMNAAACVILAYLRPYITNFLTPQSGYEQMPFVTVQSMGFSWYFTYASLGILVHHITLYLIEYWSTTFFWTSISRALLSTLFTLIATFLMQYMLFAPGRRR